MTSMLSQILLVCLVTVSLASNDPNCGTKGPKLDFARIIGGQETKPHEFPWQCSLQVYGSHICGASILNKRWILTAGHCVKNHHLEVLCGVHNLRELEGTEVRAKVTKVIRRKDYWDNEDIAVNDVAVLLIDRDLDLNDPHLGSICIPDKEPLDRLAGTSCIASGWGRTNSSNNNVSDSLKKVSLKIWKQEDCKTKWHQFKSYNITEGMICFGGGDESVCNGDSGGPFNCFNEQQNRWFSYGVSSFVHDASCIGSYPPVDARVSTYSKWIWEQIEKN